MSLTHFAFSAEPVVKLVWSQFALRHKDVVHKVITEDPRFGNADVCPLDECICEADWESDLETLRLYAR